MEIAGLKDTIKSTCIGVEMFKKSLKRGEVTPPSHARFGHAPSPYTQSPTPERSPDG